MKFVFIGRNERRKGIEELNAALNELLSNTGFEFEFHFIGPIPEESKLRDKRLIYHGEIRNQEKIKKILRASDCLVCPSHSEGMPTVILEAMASGLAVIATRVGAVERQIRDNGILIDDLSVKDLREALIDLIQLDKETLL